jgi:hypothetical protein
MPSDLERLPVSGTGPAAMAAELLGRIRAELPVIGELGEREQFLVAAWLTGLRSARTRRAYAGDMAGWLGWLAVRRRPDPRVIWESHPPPAQPRR